MNVRGVFQHAAVMLVVMLLGTAQIQSQDIHYSQFFHSPLNVNPALTGIFNGDIRLSANFKQQWASVPVPYTTFTGAYDQKFYSEDNENGFWSGGALFNYDRAGDSRLSLAQLGLSGSYSLLLNEKNIVTVGLQVGAAQRSFDMNEDLHWDNQFNEETFRFDPNLGAGENFPQESFIYFDASTGLNYRWQKDDRTNINVGAGLYHVTKPRYSFYEADSIDLPFRYNGYLMSSLQITNGLDILVNALAQFQGPATEIVPNVTFRIHLNQQRGKNLFLDLGGIGRISEETDAVTPMFGIGYRNWYAAVSYDVNISQLETASERKGGPEISFIYRITKVKPLEAFKVCPIF